MNITSFTVESEDEFYCCDCSKRVSAGETAYDIEGEFVCYDCGESEIMREQCSPANRADWQRDYERGEV